MSANQAKKGPLPQQQQQGGRPGQPIDPTKTNMPRPGQPAVGGKDTQKGGFNKLGDINNKTRKDK